MKILVVGGTGTIGQAVVDLLRKEHEVIAVGKNRGDYQIDIEDKTSIEKMFQDYKDVDGVIAITGMANVAPLNKLSDTDFDLAINNKLKGQINLIRLAMNQINTNGFMIITTGIAAVKPFLGGSSISMACAGLEGFVKAVDFESERNIRINVIRPAMVTESMEILNFKVPNSVSAVDTARVYKAVTELEESGAMINVHDCLASLEN